MGELLATADDLRLFLELDQDDEDSLLSERADLLLEGVSSSVLAYCNRSTFVEVEALDVRVDGSGYREMLLPAWPIVDVTRVVEDPDGAATEITTSVRWSADGILEQDGIFVRRRRWYAVDFTHGYPETPPAVRNVVLRVAARAVGNPEGLATEGVGGYSAGFAFDETRLPTLSAPDRRELDPFRL